jgi:serine/threonine-protein kinase
MSEPLPVSCKYHILKLVGQGQFGRVYCAIDKKSGKTVALKELDQQRFSTKKFLRELHFLSSLQHPNIISFQGLEHIQNARFLVMDYCEGGTLRNFMQSDDFHLIHGLKFIADILAGLEHAHNRGIVHCDIKPENILISAVSTNYLARISDFGLARVCHELSTEKTICTGSPAYMAPERFYGKSSPASDLYAVGVMLYELVLGFRPFSGMPGELMTAHINQAVEIPNAVPLLLRSTISTAMQKLPNKRFPSAAEMMKSVKLALEVEKVTHGDAPPLNLPTNIPSGVYLNSPQF